MSFRITLEVMCPSDWNEDYENLVMAVLQREMGQCVSKSNVEVIEVKELRASEVKELRAWKKLVSDIVKQQNGPHLREMLKELIE
tara:strand:- start:1 stop:255 length:255 start_codon:yes stop_codon:yes gene_type:complete